MTTMASHFTSLTVVYLIVYSDPGQRKRQSSASLAFVRGIHWWPVNFPHKGPVTRKIFPFDGFIITEGCVSGPLFAFKLFQLRYIHYKRWDHWPVDFWELISKFATNFTEYVMWISLQDGFDFVFCMGYGIQNDLTTAEIALGKHNYVRFDFSMGCRRVPCIRTMFVIVLLYWSKQHMVIHFMAKDGSSVDRLHCR